MGYGSIHNKLGYLERERERERENERLGKEGRGTHVRFLTATPSDKDLTAE